MVEDVATVAANVHAPVQIVNRSAAVEINDCESYHLHLDLIARCLSSYLSN
jgi:hypothetical protein